MLEVDINKFTAVKNAFKECKKYKSKIIEDSYDKLFLNPAINYQKKHIKGKEIDVHTLEEYLKNNINCANKWLNDKNKSKFYTSSRINTANKLIDTSRKLLDSIKNIPKINYDQKSIPGIGGVLINSKYKLPHCIPFVLDIPYMGFIQYTKIRCYVCVVFNGTIAKLLGSNFDFCHYEFDDNKSYCDANIESRKIYKVADIPIILPIKLGKVFIKVYISPNDWTATKAFGAITVNSDLLLPND